MGRKKRNHPRLSKPPEPPKNAAAGGGASPTTSSTHELRQEQGKTEPLASPTTSSTDEVCQEQSKTEILASPTTSSTDEVRQEQSKTESLASTTTSSTDELRQEQSKVEALDSISSDTIKTECNPALNALETGDYAEALRIMKEVCLRHKSSPLVHRIQCSVYFHIASKLDENSVQIQGHLENAVESAKEAVLLSPNSFLFALLYARMLYAASNNRKGYEEVVRECERALSIRNPIDPAKDTLRGESHCKNSTAEQRIAYVTKELQKLIENSKIASLNNRKKVETRNPNTSKQKEQRKKIEKQVAAARRVQRLQRTIEAIPSLMSTLAEQQKRADMEKIISRLNRIEQLDSYLTSMSDEQKLGLLETKICEFRAYLSSFKAEDILSEAISFNKNNNTWKFWACCFCDEKFADSESHLHHFKQEHMGNLSSNLQSVVPTEVDAHWVKMLVNCQWKPVDTPAAMRVIESQSKFQLDNLVDKGCSDVALPSLPMLYSDDQKWPLSNDSERLEILEKIHDMFQFLLKHKYLAKSHLNKLMQYTLEEMQKFVPASQLLIQALGQSPLCIRFLGASQLETVLQFLQKLAYVCGLNRDSKWDSSTDDALDGNQGLEINEEIAYTGESSRLHLNDLSLRVEFMPSTYDSSIADDGPSATFAVGHPEAAVLPDRDFILYLFSASFPIEERLGSWTHLCNYAKHQGMEVFQVLEKKWRLLQGMCEEKCEYLSHKEALQQVTESMRVEQYEKMEQGAKYVPQSYESLLRKRQEELTGRNDDCISSSSGVELDVISTILKEAPSFNANQFQFEETLTGVTSCLCDLVCCEDNKCNMQDYQHQEETYIKFTIQRQMKWMSTELSKIDAMILRTIAEMKQLEIELTRVSAHDYQSIILPLLRTFIRAQLEDLVDKDATEKAQAAKEAFLAELALDTEKNINKGGNQTKHTQEKSMNRKKKKDHRKPKEGKVTEGNKQHVLQEEDGEQPQLPVTYDGDYSKRDIEISESANTLKQWEELDRIELETVKRKLEGTLAFQRQLESEAKQEQFSMQNEKTGEILQADAAETITVGTLTVPILQDQPQEEEYIERSKKSHEEIVNLEAKEKEKGKLKEEIGECFYGINELSKEIEEKLIEIEELDMEIQLILDGIEDMQTKIRARERTIREFDVEIRKRMDWIKEPMKLEDKKTEPLNKQIDPGYDIIALLVNEIEKMMDVVRKLDKMLHEKMAGIQELHEEIREMRGWEQELCDKIRRAKKKEIQLLEF